MLELGAGGKVWFEEVPRDRGSGTVEKNEAVRKCQTSERRAAKRAKVRGHSPPEAPRAFLGELAEVRGTRKDGAM